MNFDASINMQVVAREKAVVLLFSRDTNDGAPVPALTDNMRLDPETALVAAQALTDMALEADSSIKPIGPALKASMIEKHRSVLIPRISMILNNLRERKTVDNDQLATQIMDRFCAEVFS